MIFIFYSIMEVWLQKGFAFDREGYFFFQHSFEHLEAYDESPSILA